VGLAERDQGHHIVRFSHHDLGMIDPKKKLPPFRPAAYAAGRNGGNKGRIVSTIISVQNVRNHSGLHQARPHP
jgi:hypothetical protein